MEERFSSSPFKRTILLLGEEKFKKLQNSFAVVVGLGAVGGFALEALARSGINNLRIVDFDVVDVSNINRQILATTKTVGKKKSTLALKRIKEINPNCNVDSLDLFLDEANIEKVLGNFLDFEKPDIVIDAIDSVKSKSLLLSTCIKKKIKVLSSMGAALRTKSELIKCADVMQTSGCGLARQIRLSLKKEFGFSAEKKAGIECVYSTEAVSAKLLAKCSEEKTASGVKTLGSLSTITAIFGLTLANKAIEFLSHKN